MMPARYERSSRLHGRSKDDPDQQTLLEKNLACLAIKNDLSSEDSTSSPFLGLFDVGYSVLIDCLTTDVFQFSDVNAFLTLAATQHQLSAVDLAANPRVAEIVVAAKKGKVPVRLVSSELALLLHRSQTKCDGQTSRRRTLSRHCQTVPQFLSY